MEHLDVVVWLLGWAWLMKGEKIDPETDGAVALIVFVIWVAVATLLW